MWEAFALQKLLTFFQQKKNQHICVSLNENFNKSLTNDVVSFEQLGPGQPVHLHSLIRAFTVANRITGYHRLYECRTKARMILCACAGWNDSAHFAHDRRHFSLDAAKFFSSTASWLHTIYACGLPLRVYFALVVPIIPTQQEYYNYYSQ